MRLICLWHRHQLARRMLLREPIRAASLLGRHLERCAVCAEPFCGDCLGVSERSARATCGRCLATCPACRAQVASDELSPHTRLCRACALSHPPFAHYCRRCGRRL